MINVPPRSRNKFLYLVTLLYFVFILRTLLFKPVVQVRVHHSFQNFVLAVLPTSRLCWVCFIYAWLSTSSLYRVSIYCQYGYLQTHKWKFVSYYRDYLQTICRASGDCMVLVWLPTSTLYRAFVWYKLEANKEGVLSVFFLTAFKHFTVCRVPGRLWVAG